MKQQFPEVTLGFGCLELGVRAPIGKPWLRKLGPGFRTPGLVVPILGVIISLTLVVTMTRDKAIVGGIALLTGALVYALSARSLLRKET